MPQDFFGNLTHKIALVAADIYRNIAELQLGHPSTQLEESAEVAKNHPQIASRLRPSEIRHERTDHQTDKKTRNERHIKLLG
jgi:hypothetical protein